MKPVFLFFLAVSLSSVIGAQQGTTPLELKSGFSGLRIIQQGKSLTLKQAVDVMQPVPEAISYLKKARSANTVASIISFAGGALIGWPLGTAIGGGDPQWELAIAGAGLIVTAIPFSIGAKKNAVRAVEAYNTSVQTVGKRQLRMKLAFTGNGMGLVVGL